MKRKCIDLTGRQFGYYTVLEVVPKEVQRDWGYSTKPTMWYCKCKCGEVSMIPVGNLLSGKSHGCKSCSAQGRWNGGNPWQNEKRGERNE